MTRPDLTLEALKEMREQALARGDSGKVRLADLLIERLEEPKPRAASTKPRLIERAVNAVSGVVDKALPFHTST